MTINTNLVDQLLEGYQKPDDIIGENGLLKQLTKAILEPALGAELTHHLGYEKHNPAGNNTGNSRNGFSKKSSKVSSVSWICRCLVIAIRALSP